MKTKLFLAAIASSILFLACNKNNDDATTIEGAGFMAVNLVPETTASFAISGSPVGSPLPYTTYTGGYYSIFPGARTVDVYTFGGLAASNNVNFESGKYYSLFLIDTGAALQQVVVKDEFDTLSSSTQSYIRYVNAIQGANGSPMVTLSANGTTVINASAVFASVSDFIATGAGAIEINVSDGSSVNVSRTITLENQKVYTVLLSGIAGETGEKAPQIRFIVNGTADVAAERVAGSVAAGAN